MILSEKRLLKVLLGLVIIWLLSLFLIKTLAFQDAKVTHSLSLTHFLSGQLGYDVLLFFFAQVSLHLLAGFLIWLVVIAISRQFKLSSQGTLALGIYCFGLCMFWIVYRNALSFNQSAHRHLVENLLNSPYSEHYYSIISVITGGVFLFGCLLWLLKLKSYLFGLSHKIITTFIISIATALFSFHMLNAPSDAKDIVATQKPNVILIGIDSLRPDYLNSFNKNHSALELDQFINSATVFSNAITPFARTFPSWIGILSGQYPKHSGARYNLINSKYIQPKQLLAKALKKEGYQTLIAMDERRFANINEDYGFDVNIGPKLGGGDFTLASINDIPLSNLLQDTAIFKWLFPYNYVNRAVVNTYLPQSFDRAITETLEEIPSDKPVFLTAHFCLPHWPYTWAESNGSDKKHVHSIQESRTYDYKQAVEKVDSQFKALMDNLKSNGLLENAIVIVLSDHGESHGEVLSDKKLPLTEHSTNEENVLANLVQREEWGHGTSILHHTQHEVLFAVKGYGSLQFRPGNISQRVSLLDIAPTVYDLLQLNKTDVSFDGFSLSPILTQASSEQLPERIIYLESGFNLPSILSAHPNMAQVAKEGMQHYDIEPESGLLHVKDESHEMIMRTKQRGALWKDWLLLSVDSSIQKLALINWKTGKIIMKPTLESAPEVPVQKLYESLVNFYGNEVS